VPHTIDSYLRALAHELDMSPLAKRRVVRELRQHLIDASADIGEQAAFEALGSPEVVAARFAAEARPRRRRYALVAALLAGAAAAVVTAVVLTHGSSTPAVTAIPSVRLALSEERNGHYSSAHRWIVRALSEHTSDWRLWLIRSRIGNEAGDIASPRQNLPLLVHGARPGSDLEYGTCGRQVPRHVAPREVVLELMPLQPRVLVLHAAVVRGCDVADVVSHA